MLKKTITYTDFNGTERTEDFFFHLSKMELAEMDVEIEGGMVSLLNSIVEANDTKEMFRIFKKIILASVGVKSEDGKSFIKNEEIRQSFITSPAFDDLFISLATNSDLAADFVNGIMPQDLSEKVKEDLAKLKTNSEAVPKEAVVEAVSDSSNEVNVETTATSE